jgi:hypothetical protein
MILEGFLFPIIAALPPAAFALEARGAGDSGTRYEIRLCGGTGVTLVLGTTGIAVEPHSSKPADCRISAEPVAFMLLAYRRIGRLRLILTRRLVVGGRRPWLAGRLVKALPSP